MFKVPWLRVNGFQVGVPKSHTDDENRCKPHSSQNSHFCHPVVSSCTVVGVKVIMHVVVRITNVASSSSGSGAKGCLAKVMV